MWYFLIPHPSNTFISVTYRIYPYKGRSHINVWTQINTGVQHSTVNAYAKCRICSYKCQVKESFIGNKHLGFYMDKYSNTKVMNEPINKIQNSNRLTIESLKVFNILCLVKVLGQVRYTKDTLLPWEWGTCI